MERRKLFSTTTTTKRRKLFSEEGGSVLKTVVCSDCGHKFETTASTTDLICPKCGGRRFNFLRSVYSPSVAPEKVPTRKTLFGDSEAEFQREFSNTEDKLELKLKEFSGKTLDSKSFSDNFGGLTTAEELQERGFADVTENGKVTISKDAFLQSRLFSKLIVSVTKILDLDPAVTLSKPADVISGLEERSELCPKSIVILKKAHGLVPDSESWAKDSGILGDLKLEFGGQSKPLAAFKETISKRYPDAPEGILDFLKSKGIIKTSGDNIEILK